jgi:hypothetical protein
LKDNLLSAYPNPAIDGQFKLNTKENWSVYSILGVKILNGNGDKIDLSRFAKGTYILKVGSESKILISK